MTTVLALALLISCVMCDSGHDRNLKFPPGFLFGTASSAPQIEGAWNEDGKGESGLDYYFHHVPGIVIDNSTGDVACDSYHLYKHDIPFVKMAGMDTYRFSLSWARLLPTGDVNSVNHIAVNYYNELINTVLKYNLTPVVKYWITINEVNLLCSAGYGSTIFDPGMNLPGIADYLCLHHCLLAHALVYRMYKLMPDHIKDGGKMGYSVAYNPIYPLNERDKFDSVAADLMSEFMLEWSLNPVFGSGEYPLAMRLIVDSRSLREGRKESRLPRFSPNQTLLIKGSADFMGINAYTATFASFSDHSPNLDCIRMSGDLDCYICLNPKYVTATGKLMQVVPGSLHRSLSDIRKKYNNPSVFITENGFPDAPQENLTYNPERESYFQDKISEVFKSIEEGSNLIGYLSWSLLDSFEFNNGYTLKFGMVHVDFADEQKKRTIKPILKFFRNVANYGLNVTTA